MHASPTAVRVFRALARTRLSMARFVRADHGATMTEYAILAGFVVVVALVGAKAFGVSVSNKFGNEAARVATP